MQYTKDLLQPNRKSKVRAFFGLVAVLLAAVWLIIDFRNNQDTSLLNHINTLFLMLLGVVHILGGFGYNIERWFGKAFISIDERSIRIKPDLLGKTQQAQWSNIESINYQPTVFIIKLRSGDDVRIRIGKLEYADVLKIKETVAQIAQTKEITNNI